MLSLATLYALAPDLASETKNPVKTQELQWVCVGVLLWLGFAFPFLGSRLAEISGLKQQRRIHVFQSVLFLAPAWLLLLSACSWVMRW